MWVETSLLRERVSKREEDQAPWEQSRGRQ